MIKKVTDILMNVYGYEHQGFISHPLLDKYDVILSSGRVTILLTDCINSEIVEMKIVYLDKQSAVKIPYNRDDYADIILSALLSFASRTMAQPQ